MKKGKERRESRRKGRNGEFRKRGSENRIEKKK